MMIESGWKKISKEKYRNIFDRSEILNGEKYNDSLPSD